MTIRALALLLFLVVVVVGALVISGSALRDTEDLEGASTSREVVPPVLQDGDVVHQVISLTTKPNEDDQAATVTEEYWILAGSPGTIAKAYVRVVDDSGNVAQEGFYDSEEGLLYNFSVDGASRKSQLLISARNGYSPWIGWSDRDIRDAETRGYTRDGGNRAGYAATILEKEETINGVTRSGTVEISTEFGIEVANKLVVTDAAGTLLSTYSRETLLLEIVEVDAAPPGTLNWEVPSADVLIDGRDNPMQERK
jgi:hypothetical protein